MNKYYQTLDKILQTGKIQTNRKGRIKYLLNERLMLTPADLLDIFESHGIARKKLKEELKLFMQGVRDVEKYKEAGITWWDYCGHTLVIGQFKSLKHCSFASISRRCKNAFCNAQAASSIPSRNGLQNISCIPRV